MTDARRRRLPNGETVVVHSNRGLRKVCSCPRRNWAKCSHPWHFSFRWKGKSYRFSLTRFTGKAINSKTDADDTADRLRTQIREGRFLLAAEPPSADGVVEPENLMSFSDFATVWKGTKRGGISWCGRGTITTASRS